MPHVHKVKFSQPITTEASSKIVLDNSYDRHFSPSALGLLAVLHAAGHSSEAIEPIRYEESDMDELGTLKFVRLVRKDGFNEVTLYRL